MDPENEDQGFEAFEKRVNTPESEEHLEELDKSDSENQKESSEGGEDKPADDVAEPHDSEETPSSGESDEGGDTEEEGEKGDENTAAYIRRIKKERNEALQRERDMLSRLEKIEGRLTEKETDDSVSDIGEPPDPNDEEKYPLGSLDDRYIEDVIDYRTNQKVNEAVNSVLQRQQEIAQKAEAERQQAEMRTQAENLMTKGDEAIDGFRDTVIEAVQNGFDISDVTFQALASAEHGAEILHELASNLGDASWLANQPPSRQEAYIKQRNSELTSESAKRRIPKASPPPENQPKGSSKKTQVDADTTDFAAFERKVMSQTRN